VPELLTRDLRFYETQDGPCDKARRESAASSAVRKNAIRALADGRCGRCHSRLKGHPSRNSSRSPRGLIPTTGAGSRQS
jgi:hypothetical protein